MRLVKCIGSRVGVCLFPVLLLLGQLSARAEWRPRPAQPDEAIGVYVSNGDNELLYTSPPVDSVAAIDDFLDIIQKVYHAKRLYWRGAQIEQIVNHSVRRTESRSHGEWIEWMDYLLNDAGTIAYAVAAARKRGLEVWAVAALLDHGGAAHVGAGKGYGPMIVEAKLRVEHPEWVPIDRYGIRRMSGPICLAYPEARRALVELFTEIAVKAGYDGLLFHTYAEQFHARFDDEFGFNEPIVKEFKRRFGVDIFANDKPYDLNAMAHLRGEYLTALVRELRTALAGHGIKLGLMLDSVTPHYPQRWGISDMRVTGRLIVDWPRYLEESLVDCLWVNYNGPQHETVNNVLTTVESAKSACEVVMMHSDHFPPEYQHFRTRGVSRVVPGGYQHFQWGYLEPQPVTALDGDDFIAKLSVLHQMSAGQTAFDAGRVIKATHDPRPYVRRMAVDVLGELGQDTPAAKAAAEACLQDPENCVRTYAVRALTKIGDSSSMDRIYETLVERGTYMLKNVAAPWSLQTLPVERTPELLRGLRSPHEAVRAAALDACRSGALRPDTVTTVVDLTSDPSFDIRWRAARVLGRYPSSADAKAALVKLLDDPRPVVRSMAVLQVGSQYRTGTRWVGPEHLDMVRKLTAMFAAYGDNSTSPDASWGWRCVGEALSKLGPRGEQALRQFLTQRSDKALADCAWDVLFVTLNPYKFVKTTPEEAHRGYLEHPTVKPTGAPPPPPLAEPAMMPYLVQDFEQRASSDDQKQPFADGRRESGRWHTLSKEFPDVRVTTGKRDGADNRYARLIRGRGLLEGGRIDYLLSSHRAQARLDLLRETSDSDLAVLFTCEADRWRGSTLQVQVDQAGVLKYMDAERRWHATSAKVEPGQWITLELDVDLATRTYSLMLDSGSGSSPQAERVAFRAEHPLNLLILYPNAPADNRTGIDNVMVTATNPAHASFKER